MVIQIVVLIMCHGHPKKRKLFMHDSLSYVWIANFKTFKIFKCFEFELNHFMLLLIIVF